VPVLAQDPPLERTAFRATVDGQAARIENVRGPGDSLVVMLVLDLTGDAALVDAARKAASEQIAQLPESAWVAVLKAQDHLQVLEDPTPDREKAAAAVNNYPNAGKAGMLDTLEGATRLGDSLLARSLARVAVIYITDSNIYNYREDYTNPVINSSDSRDLSRRFPDQLVKEKIQKLADSLSGYETPVFFVHLDYRSDPINEAYQRGLLQLADATGGAGAFCRSPGEIPAAVARVFGQATNHWSLFLELPPWKVRVVNVDIFNGDRDIPNRPLFKVRK
jgi:hypothetical protein